MWEMIHMPFQSFPSVTSTFYCTQTRHHMAPKTHGSRLSESAQLHTLQHFLKSGMCFLQMSVHKLVFALARNYQCVRTCSALVRAAALQHCSGHRGPVYSSTQEPAGQTNTERSSSCRWTKHFLNFYSTARVKWVLDLIWGSCILPESLWAHFAWGGISYHINTVSLALLCMPVIHY